MEVIKTKQTLIERINSQKQQKIGLVPTMGFLHEGHLSLARQAKKENELVVMSIFVNPLQFGPNEDFERYPRNEEKDTYIAEMAGIDILFMPTVEEMYPNPTSIHLSMAKGTDVLCGRSRPGHFEGVAVVLSKLFHLVQPTNAYFGLKDAQQFAIVHTLITDLNFQVNLVGLPTIREEDGLAKSSRNVYLSQRERKEAKALSESLAIGQHFVQQGETSSVVIENKVRQHLEGNTTGVIDYVSILKYPDLTEMPLIDEQFIIAIAVQFEKARLIDNIILNPNGLQIKRI